MRFFFTSLILTSVFFFPVAQAAEYLHESVAKDYEENLQEMFLHFHRNPELSNLESKTAERLAKEIRAFGYEVTEGVGSAPRWKQHHPRSMIRTLPAGYCQPFAGKCVLISCTTCRDKAWAPKILPISYSPD
jgi:hypothetical protein